mmetsp:Transcript_12754/g.26029  ORF Transcript_12754/g.26029 Transcript_12754/m.26029 type:complete len:157 (+) Transcript_12754:117-587(+)
MKFTAVSLLGLVSLAAAKDGDTHQHLRATTSNSLDEALNVNGSSCYPIKSKDECKSTIDADSSTPCVWCECAAVPPVCVSSEESKGLPPGVFDCGDASSPDENGNENNNNNNVAKTRICSSHYYSSIDITSRSRTGRCINVLLPRNVDASFIESSQ